MTEEAPVQAPTDIAGVGIHLSYVRRDLLDMKKSLENITSNFLPINQYISDKAESEKRLGALEASNAILVRYKDTFTGRLWGIVTTIGIVVGIITYLVDKILK